jgi:hypothetical protein
MGCSPDWKCIAGRAGISQPAFSANPVFKKLSAFDLADVVETLWAKEIVLTTSPKLFLAPRKSVVTIGARHGHLLGGRVFLTLNQAPTRENLQRKCQPPVG